MLKGKKITWDESLDSAETEMFVVSADGVDFRTWEKKHPLYNIDRKACSHKFKSCAAKYLVVLSIHDARVVMISGPYGNDGDDGDDEREEEEENEDD